LSTASSGQAGGVFRQLFYSVVGNTLL
jgi:hypothetical protein